MKELKSSDVYWTQQDLVSLLYCLGHEGEEIEHENGKSFDP